MADSNEAQLLSDLLSDVAREDARLDGAHLEGRVLQAVDITVADNKPRLRPLVIAAAFLACVLVPAMFWMKSNTVKTEETIAESPAPVAPKPSPSARSARSLPRASQPVNPTPAAPPRLARSPLAESPIAESPDEFVPLMPMTEQELSGPFQLVRVQMPRASLGALRSPLDHPNELVEADVLLSEDGMARAIRVSTSGSAHTWRFR